MRLLEAGTVAPGSSAQAPGKRGRSDAISQTLPLPSLPLSDSSHFSVLPHRPVRRGVLKQHSNAELRPTDRPSIASRQGRSTQQAESNAASLPPSSEQPWRLQQRRASPSAYEYRRKPLKKPPSQIARFCFLFSSPKMRCKGNLHLDLVNRRGSSRTQRRPAGILDRAAAGR